LSRIADTAGSGNKNSFLFSSQSIAVNFAIAKSQQLENKD